MSVTSVFYQIFIHDLLTLPFEQTQFQLADIIDAIEFYAVPWVESRNFSSSKKKLEDFSSFANCWRTIGQGWKYRLEIDILYSFVIECKNSLLFFSLLIGAFYYFFAW